MILENGKKPYIRRVADSIARRYMALWGVFELDGRPPPRARCAMPRLDMSYPQRLSGFHARLVSTRLNRNKGSASLQ